MGKLEGDIVGASGTGVTIELAMEGDKLPIVGGILSISLDHSVS